MLDRRDPEYRENLDWQKLRMDQAWRRGEIGDITFLRTLTLMGYAPRDAQTELNLLRMEKQPDYEARRLQASREWLAAR